jgi:MFS family permease
MTSAPNPTSRAPRRIVLLLTGSSHVLIDGFGIGISVLLALKFGEEGAFGRVGLILAAYTLATAFTEPLWGRISDATGKRGTMVGLGLVLASAAFTAFAFLPAAGAAALPCLVLLSLTTGLAVGTYHSVATALVNEVASNAERGFMQGLNNAGGSLGRTLAPTALVFGALAFGSEGFAALPFLALGLVIGIAGVRILPDSPPASGGPSAPMERIRRLIKDRFLVRIVALSFLRSAFFITAANFLPTFLVAERGMDAARMGLVMSLVMATGVVAQPLGGRISDTVNRARFTGWLLVASGASFAGFLLSVPIWLGVFLLGLSMFLVLMTFPLLFALLGDVVPREKLGLTTGLVSGAGGLSATVAQLFVGVLAQRFHPAAVLLGLALLAVLSGLAAFRLNEKAPAA